MQVFIGVFRLLREKRVSPQLTRASPNAVVMGADCVPFTLFLRRMHRLRRFHHEPNKRPCFVKRTLFVSRLLACQTAGVSPSAHVCQDVGTRVPNPRDTCADETPAGDTADYKRTN